MMKIGEYEWDPNKDLLSANGASALVYRARNEDAKHVALKIFKDSIVKGDAKANSKRKKLEEQFEMLEKLSHNNIVRHESLLYLETTNQFNQEVECPVLVMEFASEGSLVDYLQKNPTTPHREKLIWDIMEGLKFLHKKGIIHRDLKPENILIMKDAEGLPVGKISDFGISKDTINTG
ncbi:MAG: protein kinase family protein, partial [Bacteroidia bacterium]|nr:protein kinase family protein [Bacteroidia bacterium]